MHQATYIIHLFISKGEIMGKTTGEPTNPSGVVWNKKASTHRAFGEDGQTVESDSEGKTIKKVCLVGFADSYKLAPFDDPSYSIWGLNQLYRWIPRADRWFEMHKDYVGDEVDGTNYYQWLKDAPIPIYMLYKDHTIPNSIEYPLNKVVTTLGGRYYFTSTIAYMLALAIYEGFEVIEIDGIDLAADSEYSYQKPNAEYYIGIATERGIRVDVPKTSALLKQRYLYGYQDKPDDILTREDLDKRERILVEAYEKSRTQTIALEGALDECKTHRKIVAYRERGGTYEYPDVER